MGEEDRALRPFQREREIERSTKGPPKRTRRNKEEEWQGK